MASAYLYSFAKNHAFIDGNKRVALIATDCFLRRNGYYIHLTNKEFEKLILNVVTDKITKEEVAVILENNCFNLNLS